MNLNKRLIKLLPIFTSLLVLSSCTLEEEDPCDKSKYESGKFLNIETTISIVEYSSNDPVIGEPFSLEIIHLGCDGDTLKRFFNDQDTTGIDGNWTSDLYNIVLYNSEDRVVFNAIAPELDYYQQNFAKRTYKFSEFKGTGKEEISLTIYQDPQ